MNTEPQAKTRAKQFVHYYVIESEENKFPEVKESQFPIPSSLALQKINMQNKAKGKPQHIGRILRVTYDLLSGRFYLPELKDLSAVADGTKLQAMFSAAKIRIDKNYGNISQSSIFNPIPADPTTSFRIKRISDYPSSWKFIKESFGDLDIKDLPVIEANLSIMPTTAARIRPVIRKKKGAYIGVSAGADLEFMIRNKDGTEMYVFNQATPFILLDISPEIKSTYNDREMTLISAFRDSLTEKEGDVNMGSLSGSQFYSLVVMMYSGWSVQELSSYFISPKNVSSTENVLERGQQILMAGDELAKAGYKNPADRYFYYSFKVGKNFKPNINQPRVFERLNFDDNWVTIRSLLYFSDEILQMFFGAESGVVVGQMDAKSEEFCMTSNVSELKEKSNTCYWSMINHAKLDASVPESDLRFSTISPIESFFLRKRISTYPQAKSVIEDMCSKYKVEFDDIEVVVGPWQEVGYPFDAAYFDKERIIDSGMKIPVEPIPGLKIYPPFILLDIVKCPSPSDQTGNIIHEYQHYLNMKLGLVDKKVGYNMRDVQKSTRRFVKEYLFNKDEELAHIAQAKYFLSRGMSPEEIINLFMPQGIGSVDEIVMSARYHQLILKAIEQLNFEEDNFPKPSDIATGNTNATEPNKPGTAGTPQMGNSQSKPLDR